MKMKTHRCDNGQRESLDASSIIPPHDHLTIDISNGINEMESCSVLPFSFVQYCHLTCTGKMAHDDIICVFWESESCNERVASMAEWTMNVMGSSRRGVYNR